MARKRTTTKKTMSASAARTKFAKAARAKGNTKVGRAAAKARQGD